MRRVMSSLRYLRAIQLVSLAVWLGAVVLSAADEGPFRPVWMITWMVAFVVFQITFWRAMWLVNQPRMPRDD